MNADQQILTQLAKEYREVAFAPVNEEAARSVEGIERGCANAAL